MKTRQYAGVPAAGAAAPDDQGRDDRQGERNLDFDRGAVAGLALQIHGAADLLDVGLDHVQADAAAGHIGDLLGGGKSGQKNHL